MRFPKTIGVTGGIGSGKSYVCRVFTALGYPIFYADKVAKELLNQDNTIVAAVKLEFGNEAYSSNGELNRSHLSDIIFQHPNKRESINKIVHPAVRNSFKKWAETQNSSLVFQEAAILFETGGHQLFDFTLLITANTETRISRVCKRDGISHQKVKERMNVQMPEDQKRKMADFIIENNENQMILPQVLKFIDFIEKA